jgi:chromosome segregation ATPase
VCESTLHVYHDANCASLFIVHTGMSLKRHRADSNERGFGHDLNVIVQEQAQEIASLKHDKAALESCVNGLRVENEKVVNENKILKRAVTIQQERQNQAASEVEAARTYKAEADDRMKKLEHMIMTLRYHLQTQHSNPGNDFMDFTQRPPDVF